MAHVRSFLFLIMLAMMTVMGCSTTPDASSDSNDILSSTDEQIFVGDEIEMNYDPNVIMKRAESFYEKESYPEAIVEYQHFLDLHYTHVLAPYAQYKLSLSHFKKFKTIDRDPDPVQKALDAFEKLLVEFPRSRYEQEALEKISKCKELLAQHHLFVGEFYYKKQAYLAAARRFEKVIHAYPELEFAGEARYQLAVTYKQLDLPEWSRDQLLAFAQEYPSHARRAEGRQLLAALQKDHPDMVVVQHQPLVPKNILPQNRTGPLVGQLRFNSPALQSPSLTPHPTVVASSTPTMTNCPLGSWCETLPVTQNDPAIRSVPPLTATCQAGVWC